jgi:energy-coupling factor transporter ATP-binding protein EcfA2
MEPEAPIIATNAVGGPVVLSREERERHLYIVGKSGSGKSTVLFNLAMLDIMAGKGIAVIDPHGDLAEAIVDAIPRKRTHQICYLNAADSEFPVGFNPLASVPRKSHALAAAGLVAAFKNLFGDSWGPRLEHWLFQGVAALLESPRPTLVDLSRMYTDDPFRARVVRRIENPVIARFWTEEYVSYDPRFRAEAASSILNKLGQVTASPVLRNILGQTNPRFDLAYTMDHRGIFIANLAKGRIGEQASNLLGSLLLSHLQLLAMARSDLAPDKRVPFFVHVDEAGSFSTDAFASLLSEARKFGTHFSLASQYTSQLSNSVRAAVFGNAGTLMVFRVSAADAELIAPEFHPLPAHELLDQSPYRARLRRGDSGHAAIYVSPPLFGSWQRRLRVIKQSRRKFSRPRPVIERSRNTSTRKGKTYI